jgi:hypothetical protein
MKCTSFSYYLFVKALYRMPKTRKYRRIRTKRRNKKTKMKGGSGALNASRKFGTVLMNGTRTIAKGVVDDATKQELLKQKYSREIGKKL